MPHASLVLVNMTCAIAMIMIDQTVVGVVLPALQRAFAFSPTELQWVVNAYTLALGATLICGGWAGDRFGRFRAFAFGSALFAGSSLVCAVAPNPELFLIARIGQGVGAALMQPNASAIVFGAFPADRRAKAMSVYVGAGLLFLAAGPLVGGALVEHMTWHMVFLINVPIGIVAALGALWLGRGQGGGRPARLDAIGAGLLIVGTVTLTLAIQGAGEGAASVAAPVMAIVGLTAYALIFLRRKRVAEPIFDFEIISDRAFFGCCALLFCVQFAMLGQVVYGAVFVQNVLGFSPFEAGLAMLPVVLTIAVTSQYSSRLYARVNFRLLAVLGAGLIAAGFAQQAVVLGLGNILWLIPGMLMIGIGLGFLASTVTTEALARAPAAKHSVASGMVQTLRQIGGVFGIACIGAVVNTTEQAGVNAVVADMTPRVTVDPETLRLMLYSAEQGQADMLARVTEQWPDVLPTLKAIQATAIGSGYWLGAATVGAAALLSVWLFRPAAPAEPAPARQEA